MSAAKRPPRVVAELGRPETPEETAARKAENSRLYRQRKTPNNLVLSLLVTLAAVLVLVLLVPRNNDAVERTVDYQQIAVQAESQAGEGVSLAAPELPAGWRANAAEWRTGGSDQVRSWYIGLLTPADEFVGMTQALDANPTWLADRLRDQAASDTVIVEGVTWDVYRNSSPEEERGNFEYALVTMAGRSTYVLIGTAPTEEFTVLAGALSANVRESETP